MVKLVKVIKSLKPYTMDNGDFVCDFDGKHTSQFLEETTETFKRLNTLPLCVLDPVPWRALDRLKIDRQAITCPYECPYTGYTFYSIMPAALLSTDLNKKWGTIIKTACGDGADYVLDHGYHRSMWKDEIFSLSAIQRAVLGLGYTDGTCINDGSGNVCQAVVNLDNDDLLLVYFWAWYNK